MTLHPSRPALVATAVFLLAISSSDAISRTLSDYTVRDDRGGYVVDYVVKMLKMERSGRLVKFAGRCESACTIYLGLNSNQTCLTSSARFGFHLPFGSTEGGNRVAADLLLNEYPVWVHQWLQANGGLSKQLKIMPYEYASRYIKRCEDVVASR